MGPFGRILIPTPSGNQWKTKTNKIAMARTPSKAGIYFIQTKLKKRAQESNLLSTYIPLYPMLVSFV